jgi:hypothetical protein
VENASALAPTLLFHAFSNIFANTKKNWNCFSFEIRIPGGADIPEKAKNLMLLSLGKHCSGLSRSVAFVLLHPYRLKFGSDPVRILLFFTTRLQSN